MGKEPVVISRSADDLRTEKISRIFQDWIEPSVKAWRQAEKGTREAFLVMLDTTADVVNKEMTEKDPSGKFILKEDYRKFFEDNGIKAGNNARHPYNAPFVYALFNDINWTVGDEAMKDAERTRRTYAKQEASRYANIAALALRSGKKPSEIIHEHGMRPKEDMLGVGHVADLNVQHEAREKKAEDDAKREAERIKKEEADRARREEAEKNRVAKQEADRKAKIAQEIAAKEKREAAALKAALEKAERDEKAHIAAAERAAAERVKQTERMKVAEENARRQREAREAAEKKIADDKIAEEAYKAAAAREKAEMEKLVAVARDDKATQAFTPFKLTDTKKRNEALKPFERMDSIIIRLVRNGNDWMVQQIQPYEADEADDKPSRKSGQELPAPPPH